MQRKNQVFLKQAHFLFTLFVVLALVLVGCNQSSPTAEPTPTPTAAPSTATPEPPPPTPEPPTSTPIAPPPPTPVAPPPAPAAPTLNPGTMIEVKAGEVLPVVADAPGAISYKWQVQDAAGTRELPETGNAIRYTAPTTADIVIVTVAAQNEQGASPPTSLTIQVLPPIETAAIGLSGLGIPAGWMSGGAAPEQYIQLQGGSAEACHTGADCSHFSYQPGGDWGGVFWWPQACGASGTGDAWNAVRSGACGVDVLQTGRLANVKQLTFWARGDKGNEVVEFKVGAPDLNPTPGRSLGKVSLTPEWKQYSIDLAGLDLTSAVGLFLWSATDVDNPSGADFYLDDAQFEGDQATNP